MQFDDEKDINNNEENFQPESDTAISWDDLLNADDDTDFSNLIKGDVQETSASSGVNKQSGILDFDISSLESVLPENEPLSSPVEADKTQEATLEVEETVEESNDSVEEQSFDPAVTAVPVEDMADISLDMTSNVQDYNSVNENELFDVLGFGPTQSETTDSNLYANENISFADENYTEQVSNEDSIQVNTVEPEFNSFEQNNESTETLLDDEYVPYTDKKGQTGKLGLVAALLIGFIAAGCFAVYKFYPQILLAFINATNKSINSSYEAIDESRGQLGKIKKEADELLADTDELIAETDKLLAETDEMLGEKGSSGAEMTAAKIKAQNKKDKEKAKEPSEEKIIVQVQNTGRSNPFLPSTIFDATGFTSYGGGLSLPPDPLVEAPNAFEARQLLTMTVSGIMFDPEKPSAIIKFNGSDYFVQKGDRIDNYLVTLITKEFVAIKNDANTYKAYVGEAFVEENSGVKLQNNMIETKTGRQYISSGDITITTK